MWVGISPATLGSLRCSLCLTTGVIKKPKLVATDQQQTPHRGSTLLPPQSSLGLSTRWEAGGPGSTGRKQSFCHAWLPTSSSQNVRDACLITHAASYLLETFVRKAQTLRCSRTACHGAWGAWGAHAAKQRAGRVLLGPGPSCPGCLWAHSPPAPWAPGGRPRPSRFTLIPVILPEKGTHS